MICHAEDPRFGAIDGRQLLSGEGLTLACELFGAWLGDFPSRRNRGNHQSSTLFASSDSPDTMI